MGTVAVTGMAILIGAEVIARQVFHAPFIDTVLIGRLSLVFIIFLGMGWVMRQNRHIAADFVVVRLTPRVRTTVIVTGMLLALCAIAIIIIETTSFALYALKTNEQVLGRYPLPAFPFQIAIPIGFTLLGLEVVRYIARVLSGISPDESAISSTKSGETAHPSDHQGE